MLLPSNRPVIMQSEIMRGGPIVVILDTYEDLNCYEGGECCAWRSANNPPELSAGVDLALTFRSLLIARRTTLQVKIYGSTELTT